MEDCVHPVDPTKTQRDCSVIDLSNYQLHKEVDRRRTFIDNNWYNPNVSINDLAQLGFFFYKNPDHVKCFFCSVSLSDFEPNDDVLKEHVKFSPNCRLIKRREIHNIPLDAAELDRILPPVSVDECGSKRKKSRVEDEVSHPEYRLPSARLRSFDSWPVRYPDSQDLVDAGFFYSGQSDITVCFSCGLYAGKWEKDDNPWVEHQKLAIKECNYLKMNQEELKRNEKKFEQSKTLRQNNECKPEKKTETSEQEIDFDTCCKVCMAKKSSVIFLPCKHVAVCGSCSFAIGNKCPICRSPIDDKIPLIFS